MADHPWFLGCQFHPEFKSSPFEPHPLFKDFVKAAEADGFGFARKLDKKDDLPAVIEEFMRYPGPAFLEVIIDPDAGVYPMVGPGLSYDKMITGEFIKGRESKRDEKLDTGEMF